MGTTATRVITAIIAAAICITFVLYAPASAVHIGFAVVALGVCNEWIKVCIPKAEFHTRALLIGLAFAIIVILNFAPITPLMLFGVGVLLWGVLFAGLRVKLPFGGLAHALFGAIVIPISWLALIRAYHAGGAYLLHMMLFVWCADSAAYFCGRAFGKTKLAPNISPNKTWEGLLGGLILTVIVIWLVARAFALDPWQSLPYALVSGSVMVGVSVLGDLYQSARKRIAGVKDSGVLLPGHGGLWDRLDSILPVSILYALVTGALH